MSEFIYLVTPASIGVFIFTRQKKKIRSVDVFLLYLFNVMVTNMFYNLFMSKFYPKIVYTTTQNFKMMVLLSIISFVFGLIYVYVDKRFSIFIEDKKDEKKDK